MKKSEQITDLAAALAKAQGLIEGAKKGKENEFFNSKYATLQAVWDACREALSTNGLAVVQTPYTDDVGNVGITTILTHSSGQWIEDSLTFPPVKKDPQGYGSAITYMRRYALSAMVGVAPDDDDGNAASSGKGQAAPVARNHRQQQPAPKTEPRTSANKARKDGVEFGGDEGVDWAKIEGYIRSAPPERMPEVKQRIEDNANAWPPSWVTSAWELHDARQKELDDARDALEAAE